MDQRHGNEIIKRRKPTNWDQHHGKPSAAAIGASAAGGSQGIGRPLAFLGVDSLAINDSKWGYVWKLEYTIWLFNIAMENHHV